MNRGERTFRFGSYLGPLILLLFARSPAQDSIAISDFRYPETRAIDWKGGINGSFDQQNREYSPSGFYPILGGYSGGAQGTETDNTMQGLYALNSSFLYFHSKDDHDQTFQLSVSGSYQPFRDDRTLMNSTRSEEEFTRTSWSAALVERWTYLHYLSDQGFHFLGSIATDYQVSGYEIDDQVTPPQYQGNSHELDKWSSVRFRGSLGVGYGRLRDGTFVFRALRIIDRLREDGVLSRPLSRTETLDLVDRVAGKKEYTTNYERPDKYFIRDVVAELTRLGVIAPGAVQAYSTLRIQEGFQENLTQRMFGWRVYYSFNDFHDQNKNEYFHTSYSGEGFQDAWSHVHEFGIEYGDPLSLYTHLSARCILDIPVHEHETQSTVTASVTLSHQLGERLEIDGSYELLSGLRYTPIANVIPYTRSTVHTVQGNFVYFIEDRVRFVLGMAYDAARDHAYGYASGFTPVITRFSGFKFSFGLVYNII